MPNCAGRTVLADLKERFPAGSIMTTFREMGVTAVENAQDAQRWAELQDIVNSSKPGNRAMNNPYGGNRDEKAGDNNKNDGQAGAQAPSNLYPQAIPFEVAMEQIRGHYRIDLNNTGNPDSASLGFADESGVHSKQYRKIF